MLSFIGSRNGHFCDGVSRRNSFKSARSARASRSPRLPGAGRHEEGRHTVEGDEVRHLHLPAGGPSHLTCNDLKPDAPKEIRGEFNPVKTNVPGVQISEHFPLQAKMLDNSPSCARSPAWTNTPTAS